MSTIPLFRDKYSLLSALFAALLWFAAGKVHAEIGVSEARVLLGQSAPLSGPSGELGRLFNRGASAYFSKVNADGGVHGRYIELIARDDQYEPERTVKNTEQLIRKDAVFALFGYVGTPTARAALPLVNQAGIPFFAPVSGAQFLREPFNALVFNIRASYEVEVGYMLKQLISSGKKQVAVLYQNDEFGWSTLEILQRKLAEKNIQLIVSASVERNSQEVAGAIGRIAPHQPDAIIVVSSYVSSAAFIKAMRKGGYRGIFYNLSFVGATSLLASLQGEGAGNVITQVVPFPWSKRVPIVYEYQKVYGEQHGGKFDFSSLEGFIAAKILVEGLKRTGRLLTRERFMQALESISTKNYDAGGFDIRFEPGNHNGSSYVDVTGIAYGSKLIN
ncbi:ABC transporter substrate-binding protein [Herbaspirillum rhizosphaerae]|uniref:ABC transporter substrate-binding protein n=1 Tax=Herbaspirillum rhizosphaerae TaxID=346179 RepID=UPI0009FAC951|nr:ABC transporter substrate-binding protein [Herbaspirillum rhizosphaerae]